MANKFRIIVVCTGNVCRSPMAEQLLSAHLENQSGIELASAGTRAMVGAAMDPESQRQAHLLGVVDTTQHRARQLTEDILESSDLILALDREHRKDIVQLSPRVIRKTYTLLELARLEAVTTDEWLERELESEASMDRLRAGVKAVGANRSLLPPLTVASDEDVIDPYGGSVQVHETAAQQIAPAVESVARLLRRMTV